MRRLLKKLKRYWPLYVMLLPGTAYLVINNYLPMAGIVVAFKQFNYQKGIFGSPWNGIKNFEFLFKTRDAWTITRNTLGYNLIFIIPEQKGLSDMPAYTFYYFHCCCKLYCLWFLFHRVRFCQ